MFSREPAERNPETPELEVRGFAGPLPMVIGHGIAEAIAERRPTDVILQYTPQMWDAWRFGSPALAVLASRAREAGAKVTLIAHEPFVPWYRRPDLFLAALMQRVHFAAVLRSCDHVFVTTETRLLYVVPYCRALNLAGSGRDPHRRERVAGGARHPDPRNGPAPGSASFRPPRSARGSTSCWMPSRGSRASTPRLSSC